MVKAKLRVIVEDPLVKDKYGLAPEDVETEEEPFFLDGPVAERVAIIDRNLERILFHSCPTDSKGIK